MDLRTAVEAWFRKKARNWTPKVCQDVQRHIRSWLGVWGEREIGELKVADVERLEELLDDGTRSGARLNSVRTYLRMFLNYSREMEWGPVNDPTKLWKWRSTEVKREYAPLSREEEERLCAVAPDWLRKFVRVSIGTGQREGTVRQLTWDMVKPLQSGGTIIEIPGTIIKQRKPHRMPLAERVLQALGARGSGLLIPGMPQPSTLYGAFKKYGRLAGVNPKSSPHDCKRTCIQRLSDAGVPLQRIMALVGNRSVSILLKHYCSSVSVKEAQETMDLV